MDTSRGRDPTMPGPSTSPPLPAPRACAAPLRSWVQSANRDDADFPLAHLPLCVFRPAGTDAIARIGVGIGQEVFDLRRAWRLGLLDTLAPELRRACAAPSLNVLFAAGRAASRALRAALTALLQEGAPDQERSASCLLPQSQAAFELPAQVGDYTDFLASYNHAHNVGSLYRPDNPVLPNFSSLPVAYHGRASSLVVTDEPVCRPQGQFRAAPQDTATVFGPSRKLDFEMELGVFVGPGNARGHAIAVDAADAHVAGFCVLNDWSARDLQEWESQPLGPFLGKNFATTLSPWVVSPEALEPYWVEIARPASPPLKDYLRHAPSSSRASFEIVTEVRLCTQRMRAQGQAAQLIATALFSRDIVWSFAQMIAHHTVNGCKLRPGDLLGSGTVSGPTPGSEGCLLELTRGGRAPLTLANGETRTYLQDGDEIVLTAFCARPGLPRIGFGECRGRIVPALARD